MRIAVLSDQHIHRAAASASWELAQRAFRAAARYDHVVLAGDTFDSATAFENDHERVRDFLAKLRLWRRDRLTVVPGNHDLFHTPHHGSLPARVAEYAKLSLSFDARGLVRDASVERDFDAWAKELTVAADRLDARRPFPMRKVLGHVALYAADTAPRRTLSAANGFWRPETDALLRAATPAADERRVLAIHHPPKESKRAGLEHVARSLRRLRPTMPVAFPPKNFARLERFVADTELDAVVCGHIHSSSRYAWAITERAAARAFMVGRSGGLSSKTPVLGILTVPRRSPVSWHEEGF